MDCKHCGALWNGLQDKDVPSFYLWRESSSSALPEGIGEGAHVCAASCSTGRAFQEKRILACTGLVAQKLQAASLSKRSSGWISGLRWGWRWWVELQGEKLEHLALTRSRSLCQAAVFELHPVGNTETSLRLHFVKISEAASQEEIRGNQTGV